MEDADLNFYSHLEWLRTIYVSKLDEMNKQDEKHSAEVAQMNEALDEMRKMMDSFKSTVKQKSSTICELQNQLEIREKEVEWLKSADGEMARTAENYYKIPRLVRRIFVRE